MVLDDKNYGYTDIMGPLLREYVKRSLVQDLQHYLSKDQKVEYSDCIFDWSETCIEGHRATYLDGQLENFSGIRIYDHFNNLVVDGWMDFVPEGDNLHVYWLFLHGGSRYKIQSKETVDIPQQIWRLLDSSTKKTWAKYKPHDL